MCPTERPTDLDHHLSIIEHVPSSVCDALEERRGEERKGEERRGEGGGVRGSPACCVFKAEVGASAIERQRRGRLESE